MTRPQHGRKPQKSWHRRGAGRRFLAAVRRMPKGVTETTYGGAPTPLRQGHIKRKGMRS